MRRRLITVKRRYQTGKANKLCIRTSILNAFPPTPSGFYRREAYAEAAPASTDRLTLRYRDPMIGSAARVARVDVMEVNSMNDTGLGQAARSRRKALGLTQSRLAELTGLSQPVISRFEAAGVLPPFPALRRIADVLGLRLVLRFEPGP